MLEPPCAPLTRHGVALFQGWRLSSVDGSDAGSAAALLSSCEAHGKGCVCHARPVLLLLWACRRLRLTCSCPLFAEELEFHLRNPEKCATLGSPEGVVSRNNEFRAAADLKAKVLGLLNEFETTLEVRNGSWEEGTLFLSSVGWRQSGALF